MLNIIESNNKIEHDATRRICGSWSGKLRFNWFANNFGIAGRTAHFVDGAKINMMSLTAHDNRKTMGSDKLKSMGSSPHRMVLSLRSPQRSAGRPLTQAAHQIAGAHRSLRLQALRAFRLRRSGSAPCVMKEI